MQTNIKQMKKHQSLQATLPTALTSSIKYICFKILRTDFLVPVAETLYPKSEASSRQVKCWGYLSRHDSLSLHYEFTFETLTVPPVAEALVSLQRRYETVVPAAGALGHPGGFRAFGRGHGSGRCFALLLLGHRCWTWEDLIYGAESERVAGEVKRGGCRRSPTYPALLPLLWEEGEAASGGGNWHRTGIYPLHSLCFILELSIQNTDPIYSCSSHII